MERRMIWVALALLAPLAGCGKSADVPAPTDQGSTPDQTVSRFLEAVCQGNTEQANKLLTPLAREKTAQTQMVLSRPGSDKATFKLAGVEYIAADGAHVGTVWTDIDEDGQQYIDNVVWVLRKEPEGWRISGMATRVFEDQPAVMLNFEDPDDMVRKQNLAEQEKARRDQAGHQEARKASTGGEKTSR